MRLWQALKLTGTENRRDVWIILCSALIFSIALSPRIPIPVAVAGRPFDLRIADFVLALALPVWAFTRSGMISRTRLTAAIAIYLLIGFVTTLVAIAFSELKPVRALLYLGKEIEFFAILLIALTTVRTERGARALLYSILGAAGLNALWFAYQLLVDRHMSLITVVPYELSYGPHLIGEGSPFSVGAFFMLAFLLVICFLASANETRVRLALLLFAATLFACLVITQSRITLLGAILGSPFVIATAWNHRRRALATVVISGVLGFLLSGVAGLREAEPVVVVVLPTAPVTASLTPPRPTLTTPAGATQSAAVSATPNVATSGGNPSASATTGIGTPGPAVIAVPNPREALASGVVSRLSASLIEFSVAQRSGIWLPVLDKAIDRPLTGYGKGALGDVAGLEWIEAHNYYLRVFVESGAFGLAAFVGLLAVVFTMSWSLLRDPEPTTRLTGQFIVAATVAMASAALLQDGFLAVLPNELYWLSVGMAASLARYSRTQRRRVSGSIEALEMPTVAKPDRIGPVEDPQPQRAPRPLYR